MKKNNKKSNLSSRSLKVKLKLAFALSSVIPILILLNMLNPSLFSFTFRLNEIQPITIKFWPIFIITTVIVSLGYYILKLIIDPVISISRDAKHIAQGDFERVIKVGADRGDEIGDLSFALDKLTTRIRSSMQELSQYGEKTKKINLEINKRVVVLSNLLQISTLISQGANLNEILHLSVDRIMEVGQSEIGFLMVKEQMKNVLTMRSLRGVGAGRFENLEIAIGENPLADLIYRKEVIILDQNNKDTSREVNAWQEKFAMRNAVIIPLFVRGDPLGIICIANNKENFSYTSDDLEVIEIFVKQIAIALETDFLHFRVQKLEVKDALTGLYNERFVKARLDEEIKRAIIYQRPCAFLLFNVDNFKRYYTLFGGLASEAALKRIALVLEDSITDVDRVGRFGDNDFAVILPERNKKEANKIAEDIRKKLEFVFKEEPDANKRITLSGGVSENPIDGVSAQELVVKARQMLMEAKARGKNQIKG
ncbi:MAG: diguanylate cyclase [Candidatus Omnitrophica bacterium]|nr:diguanylate cyclase [Candidatus Omnitrophota bacterium]